VDAGLWVDQASALKGRGGGRVGMERDLAASGGSGEQCGERETTRGHRADARAAASIVHEWVWLDAGVDAGLWVDQASALKGRRDWLKFVGCHSHSYSPTHPLTNDRPEQSTHRRSWGVLCCALPVCWHPCAPPGMAGDRPTREDGDQLLELGVVVTVCGLWIVDVVVTVSELGCGVAVYSIRFKVQGSDMWVQMY
jgi:hypothetical protein